MQAKKGIVKNMKSHKLNKESAYGAKGAKCTGKANCSCPKCSKKGGDEEMRKGGKKC